MTGETAVDDLGGELAARDTGPGVTDAVAADERPADERPADESVEERVDGEPAGAAAVAPDAAFDRFPSELK